MLGDVCAIPKFIPKVIFNVFNSFLLFHEWKYTLTWQFKKNWERDASISKLFLIPRLLFLVTPLIYMYLKCKHCAWSFLIVLLNIVFMKIHKYFCFEYLLNVEIVWEGNYLVHCTINWLFIIYENISRTVKIIIPSINCKYDISL